MSTRNMTPRANEEGEVGVVGKVWKALRAKIIEATSKMTAPTVEATSKMTAPTVEATSKMTAPTVEASDKSKNVATTEFVKNRENMVVSPFLLQRNTAYKIGDMVKVPKLGEQYVLECTQSGTTAATEPNLSTVTGGVEVNDGSTRWTVKTVTAKEYVDEKFDNYGRMETINATIDPQYIENLSCVKIKNIVHLFVRMKGAKEGLIEIASGLPKSFINLEFYAPINNSNGKAVRLTINTDGKLYLSYTDEYTTSPGHESVACLVYLTND